MQKRGGENLYRKKIDSLGRILIPMELRTKLNLQEGDEFHLTPTDSGFLVEKREAKCLCCSQKEDLLLIRGNFFLCKNCLQNLWNQTT